jgi:hypothetical protein
MRTLRLNGNVAAHRGNGEESPPVGLPSRGGFSHEYLNVAGTPDMTDFP